MDDQDVMVSLDVTNHFPSVLIQNTLDIVNEHLERDTSLLARTSLSTDWIGLTNCYAFALTQYMFNIRRHFILTNRDNQWVNHCRQHWPAYKLIGSKKVYS